MSRFLSRILESKRAEVEAHKAQMAQGELERRVRDLPSTYGFLAALRAAPEPVALIAEVKRASPSKGLIREAFEPVQIAQEYAGAGATALSVLTDEPFFGGHLEHLSSIRATVQLPLLRKDFIVDPYQIYESRLAGADAILFIVAAFDSASCLREWREQAALLGLDTLVEVHREEELELALLSGATLIGINNRDLHTFETTLETTFRLLPLIPPHATAVSESGIESRQQVQRLQEAGVRAILVGESLMRAEDPAAKIRELLGKS